MPKLLTVSDEIVEFLWTERVAERFGSVDLVLAAGDLPFDYLDFLASALDRPLVFVPGNHDADLSGYSRRRGLWLASGFPARYPGPDGAVNADGRVVEAAGLRIAGLGGSIRYNDGPNQWTERQQARRAAKLVRSARGRPVDVLLTHSPPLGVGDRDDPPHRGFACLHTVVERLKPTIFVHGHIHPHGQPVPDRSMGETRVLNTVGYRILDVP
ncbi:metallophosphoesterase family protein [Actinophytocola algeriensis]|uniref:Putative phosphodiesterase n=1 Tax=Actinophytocola algeriensis TaxID=1768010 RepID=A0A7W7QEV9_9PSEU|nr:metallophosphoesterase [Actinophytocola algeriensis]MBB4912019.1 putative phosphodiesterase [Actinophytocola algeriensis]MBE1477489.1 putative phosphodiesterase [Actinophytocola algeriensis]